MSGLNLFLRYYAAIVVSVGYEISAYFGIVMHTWNVLLGVILTTIVLYDVVCLWWSYDQRANEKPDRDWVDAFRKKHPRAGADWYAKLHRGLKEQ